MTDAELPERLRGSVLALCGAVTVLGLMILAVWCALDDLADRVETVRASRAFGARPVVVYITPPKDGEATLG